MEAIVELGVVEAEGRGKLISRIENLERGGVIEKNGGRELNIVS